MSALRDYFSWHIDLMSLMEVRNERGGIDYVLKIDGTYSDEGAEGMLEYHRDLLRAVLEDEGLL